MKRHRHRWWVMVQPSLQWMFLAILLSTAKAQNCFGGIESFEKTTGFAYGSQVIGSTILQQPDQALTKDCINLCKQQSQCQSFSLNFVGHKCTSFNLNSQGRRELLVTTPSTNYYEKICFRGIQKTSFDSLCGDRLWAFERVKEAHLEGYVDKEQQNVKDKEECMKMCLLEEEFPCRSADFDEKLKMCRMSREDRRSQPQAFRIVPGSYRDYLENQCSATAPTSCRYETRVGITVVSMDLFQFASAVDDCQTQCDREATFNCRAYSYMENRCYLSADDSIALGPSGLPAEINAAYGEKKCVTEQCTLGVFTYEKITGFVMRSAARTAIPLSTSGALGNTLECRQFCHMAGLDCPAFSVNYQNMRCDKLDRNSQGRTQELSPRAGENYFEKICLRGNFATACQGKAWAFERVLGVELVNTLYDKSFSHVLSRRDCEEHCLNEQTFNCRSAVYYDDTAECRLSRHDRRTQPDGVVKGSNPRVNYLENQCIEENPTCPWEKTADAYPIYTDVVQTTGIVSEQACESFCTTYPNFHCRSYAYYPSNGQCFISGEDRTSAGPGNTNSRPGILFFERACRDGGLTVTPSTIDTRPTLPVTGGHTFPTHSPVTPTLFPPISLGVEKASQSSESKSQSQVVHMNQPRDTSHHTTTTASSRHIEPSGVPQPLPEKLPFVEKLAVRRLPPTPVSSKQCNAGERLTFARVAAHESPTRPGAILLTSPTDGMTLDCVRLCEDRTDCRSFAIDYRRHECYIAGYYGGPVPAHLRPSPGKTYFEGICIRSTAACYRKWAIERLIDQEIRGVYARESIRYISLHDCERRCIEERNYVCKSATFDLNLQECKLYTDDRTAPFARLLFARGVYYLENQCAVNTAPCRYAPIQRDVYMTHVTRVVHGVTSTFQCELECNREVDFNCRSYTYVEHGTLGPPQCLLSVDNRQSVPPTVLETRTRALFAEKDCSLGTDGRTSENVQPGPPYPHPSPGPSRPPNFPPTSGPVTGLPYPPPSPGPLIPGPPPPYPTVKPYPPGGPTHTPIYPLPPSFCSYDQYTFEKTMGYDMRYAPREAVATRATVGVVQDAFTECQRLGDRCRAFVIEYGNFQTAAWLSSAAEDHRNALTPHPTMAYFEKVCFHERPCGKIWTFERVLNHDMRTTPDRELPNVKRRAECEDHCLRERGFPCRSATYQSSRQICRLFTDTRRSNPQAYQLTNEDVDYLENMCAPEASTCQYRDNVDRFLPVIDRLTHAFSLSECQRQCDLEKQFSCRGVNFETVHHDCALSSEDVHSYPLGAGGMILRRFSIFSEKGACEQVSVQCNQQDMVLTLNFDGPFNGRVYSKGNPAQCFVVGTGANQLQFAISLATRCGTVQDGPGRYVNEVVVQQHPIIMMDTDRNIRVVCSFEAGDRTVTLASTFARQGSIGGPIGLPVGGLDVTTGHQPTITSVVTNTAPPPNVGMRILDSTGRDAAVVGLGDELTLKIEIRDPQSAFAIFARNLYARSSGGESLFLIDATGCPVDPLIFPPLRVDYNDPKSLASTFKAFRFPSSGMVNFEVQIRFCQERCEPVRCHLGAESYGRRKKRDVSNMRSIIRASGTNKTLTIHGRVVLEEEEDQNSSVEQDPQSESTESSRLLRNENEPEIETELEMETETPIPEAATVETIAPGTLSDVDIRDIDNDETTDYPGIAKRHLFDSSENITLVPDNGENVTTAALEAPQDLSSQPYGGYGLGYGRHYSKVLPNIATPSTTSNVNPQQLPTNNKLPAELENPTAWKKPTVLNDTVMIKIGRALELTQKPPAAVPKPMGIPDEIKISTTVIQRPFQAQGGYSENVGAGFYFKAPENTPQDRNLLVESPAWQPFPSGPRYVSRIQELPPTGGAADRFAMGRSWIGPDVNKQIDSDKQEPIAKGYVKPGPPPEQRQNKLERTPIQEIVATTEKPDYEEVPLSLAIMVGDEPVKVDNGWNREGYKPPRARKRDPIGRDNYTEEIDCDSHSTVIITALVVTAIHVGITLGGYFCYRWQKKAFKRRSYFGPNPLVGTSIGGGALQQLGSQFYFQPSHQQQLQAAIAAAAVQQQQQVHHHRSAQTPPPSFLASSGSSKHIRESSSTNPTGVQQQNNLNTGRPTLVYGNSDMTFRQIYSDFESPP